MRTGLAVFAMVSLLLPRTASSQSIRGVVLGAGDTRIPGAVVQLIDSARSVVAHSLTNERGEYQLDAQKAGTYQLRTLRIGFRSTLSERLTLGAGESVTRQIALSGIAFALDTVHVNEHSVCRDADGSATAFAVWEQARTALTATQLTLSDSGMQVNSIDRYRIYDRGGEKLLRQVSKARTAAAAQPWTALPVDSLRKIGYMLTTPDSTIYRAPGLDMLASSEFVADHCFRLVEAKGDTALVGVVFEPTRERGKVAEIKGTLWLDRKTSELRSLQFTYVNTPLAAQEKLAGGTMTFTPMRNGAWAITDWDLHMPTIAAGSERMSRGRLATSITVPVVLDVRSTGGELLLARRGRDTVWVGRGVGITGTVLDSLTGGGLANARVELQGQSIDAVTDSAGRFDFPPVPPGDYVLAVRTASLDSMRAVHRLRVSLVDSVAPLTVRAPDATLLAATMCGTAVARGIGRAKGIVLGTLSGTTKSVAVSAEWTDSLGAVRWLESRSDNAGQFRLCGVPLATALTLRASSDTGSASPLQLTLPDGARIAQTALVFDAARPSTATFVGVVVADSTFAPIGDAEVAIQDMGVTVRTSPTGTFRIAGITPGAHTVVARKIGFGAISTQLTFTSNQRLQRRIVLGRVSMLDEVKVTATSNGPWVREYDERQKMGLGTFFNRDQLAKFDGGQLRNVLAATRGIRISPKGDTLISSRRNCYVHWYLDRVLLYAGRPGDVVPHLNEFPPETIEAIEYYAGPSETPMELNHLNAVCGVIVIHTRESP